MSGASGTGHIVIPGVAVPDRVPASPSAYDDEFDALSGWTTLGTLDTSNVTDAASHWHVKRNFPGIECDGIYKTAPSMPFTVTAKVSDQIGPAIAHVALMLTEASPGKLFTVGYVFGSGYGNWGDYSWRKWTNRTTVASLSDNNVGTSYWPFRYLRIVVHASNNIDCQVSKDGFLWYAHIAAGLDSGLTVANVGLAVACYSGTGIVEAVFDWIRFT